MGNPMWTQEDPLPGEPDAHVVYANGRVEYDDWWGQRQSVPARMKVDEFLRLPKTKFGAELIFGQVVVRQNSPRVSHQDILAELFPLLRAFVRERQLGKVWFAPLSTVFSEEDDVVLQPDMMFFSNERLAAVEADDWPRMAPDVAIEVLSPSDRLSAINARVRCFAQYGVREGWLIRQAERRTDVVECASGRVGPAVSIPWTEPLQSRIFPAFTPILSDVFGQY